MLVDDRFARTGPRNVSLLLLMVLVVMATAVVVRAIPSGDAAAAGARRLRGRLRLAR